MKCKYRVRWFSSKGAFLVLLWTLLVFSSFSHILINFNHQMLWPSAPSRWLTAIPFLMLIFVSAPLSGWLADAKFGNYKVFRAGAVLLFISTVINCLFLILEALVLKKNYVPVLRWTHLYIGGSLFVVGGCACSVTALPLGLDQMPDASSASITSYIAWFVCNIYFGGLLSKVLSLLSLNKSNFSLIGAILSTLCIGVVLISNFLFSPKWLIIEPKSPQSLKTIYRVLKFAAKHKAPLNRSAFTYWEEDIPSRIDLGKSKYGGPFTTEQVEDVKTILRLFLMSLPLFFVALSLSNKLDTTTPPSANLTGLHSASILNTVDVFASNLSVYGILGTFTCEFLVYPLAKNKLPSILKRIGVVPLILTFVSLICFIVKLIQYMHWQPHSSDTLLDLFVLFFYTTISGLLSQVFLTSVLEFLCAQSPYNMRGLLISFIVPLLVLYIVGWHVIVSHKLCSQSWCSLMSFSVKIVMCFFGFLLFCVVARWYKKRVRDEDYSTQRVVEEVYDRYLTAAAAQPRCIQ